MNVFQIQGQLLRFLGCYFVVFLSWVVCLFVMFFSILENFLYVFISSVLTATFLLARFGAAAYDVSTTVGVAISTSFLAFVNNRMLDPFFQFPTWTFSRVCTVGTLAIDPEDILGTCLVVMVKLTKTYACQFATTGISTMSKPLAFEATQGIWNKGLNRYSKITCFHSTRKGWNVRIKVYVGNRSLLRRICIHLTAVTFCEDTF